MPFAGPEIPCISGIYSANSMKWFGLVTMIFTVAAYGYTMFLPGCWELGAFFSYCTNVLRLPGFT
jgi:hypothetical protein